MGSEPTIAVSVRVRVSDMVVIGRYLNERGLFRSAQPSGVLAHAVKMFTQAILSQELLRPPMSLKEALVWWGQLRYPTTQLEKALRDATMAEHRAASEAEQTKAEIEVFGAPMKEIEAMQASVRALNAEDAAKLRERLMDPSEDPHVVEANPKSMEEIKAEVKQRAAAMGTLEGTEAPVRPPLELQELDDLLTEIGE